MTWLSTWPADGVPNFAQHASEQGAEEHAKVKGGVAFWSSDEACSGTAVGVAGVEVGQNHTGVIRGRQIGSERTGGAA